ncbi:MAG: hypothetical protein NDF54_00090 [archaeon GB-1867-035]|nr:hypothetical protein [Candidatus Culexmicrobium profundum]
MYVEPTPTVVETLKKAIKLITKEEFLAKTKTTEKELEEYIKGEKWIPLDVISIACKINRQHGKKPSTLGEAIKNAVVLVKPPTEKKKEKTEMIKEAEKVENEIRIEEREKQKDIIEQRKKLFKTILLRSTILLTLMAPFIILGYMIGKIYSEAHANLGIVIGIIAWLFTIITYTLLATPKNLRQGFYK